MKNNKTSFYHFLNWKNFVSWYSTTEHLVWLGIGEFLTADGTTVSDGLGSAYTIHQGKKMMYLSLPVTANVKAQYRASQLLEKCMIIN